MERLPTEILIYIAGFLEPVDIVRLQLASRRFLSTFRDNTLWRSICFDHSRAESLRWQAEMMGAQDPDLAVLREAIVTAAAAPENDTATVAAGSDAHRQYQSLKAKRRQRALANWDSTYPKESIDFYQEYIHRHAPISVSWLQYAKSDPTDGQQPLEATGVSLLYNENCAADKVVGAMEDGSISVWDLRPSSRDFQQGRIIHRTPPGLLSTNGKVTDSPQLRAMSKNIMTETGAVECVSIDQTQNRAFFAVQNTLSQVDLTTLKVISREPFPFSITAVSEAAHPTPLTIGTNMTLHLHDPRVHHHHSPPDPTLRTELIGGSPPKPNFARFFTPSSLTASQPQPSHATLTEPGPLSILHLPPSRAWDGNGSIWVAGRFTSLLNYDRRFFPRIRGTVFSGARLSCMASLPYPYLPHHRAEDAAWSTAAGAGAGAGTALDANAKAQGLEVEGSTIVAAGEYKGKGSLELYGLSDEPAYTTLSTDALATAQGRANVYRNRQTAARSKLLSVAAHGARWVFSDGDGNVKWVERDGHTRVRGFNVNDVLDGGVVGGANGGGGGGGGGEGGSGQGRVDVNLEPGALSFHGDIVQKIIPTKGNGTDSRYLNKDDLLIWTGDGRLGLVGFNSKPGFSADGFEERAQSEEERRREEEEREYGGMMRRALEGQASEVRWVRGLGLL